MANPVVRSIAFYWREKKAMEANKVAVEFMMGREPIYGAEGIAAWSRGNAIMKLTISGFTPIGGSYTSNDIERILAQEDIPISFVLGDKYYRENAAAVTNLKFNSDTEKNMTDEVIELSCKKPNITG